MKVKSTKNKSVRKNQSKGIKSTKNKSVPGKDKNKAKGSNKGGRPEGTGKYKPEYIKKLLDYFDIKAFEIKFSVKTFKDGSTEEKKYREANAVPTLAGFARKIKVCRDTINEWSKPENVEKYPGFSDALKRAKDIQEDILITNGVLGLYSTGSFAFTAKNIIGWRDNYGVDMTTKGRMIKSNTYVVPGFNDNIEDEATKIGGDKTED